MAATDTAVRKNLALRQIDDLTPDPRNARTHSPAQIDQLVASIARFGWTNPVLADDLIRAGHGRVTAARAIYESGGTIYLAPGKANGGKALPHGTVPVIDCTGWSEDERKAYTLADNQLALQAGWDREILMAQIEELQAVEFDLPTIGFDQAALDALADLGGVIATGEAGAGEAGEAGAGASGKSGAGALADEFMIPPFTVMSAREGWWMNRKRLWLALGIKSEVGRGENLLNMSDTMLEPDPEKRAAMQAAREAAKGKALTFGQDIMRGEHQVGETKGRKPGLGGVTMDALSSHPRYYEQKTAAEAKLGRKLTNEEFERDHWVLPDSDLSSGTSIFDPVLCELSYRWFSPPAGRVLDPFAGGSVRGIVAACLGRHYTGVDLRPEQIEANIAQWPGVKEAAQISADGPDPRWIAGDSNKVLAADAPDDQIGDGYDFIFSCPPYGDLEVYSDDPDDISTLEMAAFDAIYAEIIAKAVARLADNRFACFVVGDYRNKAGIYANFVSKTIAAFEAAGAPLYNEAILVTSVGSLPIRAAKQFRTTRKLGKTHQNVLVFVKGDPRKAVADIGPVDISDALIASLVDQAEGDAAAPASTPGDDEAPRYGGFVADWAARSDHGDPPDHPGRRARMAGGRLPPRIDRDQPARRERIGVRA